MTVSDGFSQPVNHGRSEGSRDESGSSRELPREILLGLLHPKERSRAILVWASAAITCLVLLYIIVSLTFFLLFIVFFAGSLWVSKQLLYAWFRGGAVEIGPAQFPDIHQRIVEAAARLGVRQKIAPFVVHDGELNAFFLRMSGRKVLVINSKMVEDMSATELDFIILRFLGYLRARREDLGSVAHAVDVLNQVPVLGFLTKSYSRAAVLSGDRIGAYACGSPAAARSALAKFAVGAKLETQFSEGTYLRQAQIFRHSPWNFLSRLWRDHPHFSDRLIELDDWINHTTAQAR